MMPVWLKNFYTKYSPWIHWLLLAWNLFVTSWATKESIPLDSIGIPFSINATAIVVWIQAHVHLPTWIVWIVTLLVNASMAYISWKKKHSTGTANNGNTKG